MIELTVSDFADTRIDTLRRFDILDTLPEDGFDDLAKLAAIAVQAPIAAICFIDNDRVWVKASSGTDVETLPSEFGACSDLLALDPGSLEIVHSKLKVKGKKPELVPGIPDAKTWIAAPIYCSNSEHLLGAVCVFDTTERNLDDEQRQALLAIGRQVTRLLELKQAAANLELATVKMQVLIDRDTVTGLPTDRVFRSHLRTEFQYARRHGQPLSLVLIKLHPGQEPRDHDPIAFDDFVKKLSRLLGRDTREYDLIARSSENEFAIVMRNATGEIGIRVAGRLKTRIASSEINLGKLPLQFAVSSLTPDMVSSRDLIIKASEDFGEMKAVGVG